MANNNDKIKYLTIDVQFKDESDLKEILVRVHNMVKLGCQSFKQQHDSTLYEYELGYLFSPGIDYRFEEINGQKCMILPSKMNEK